MVDPDGFRRASCGRKVPFENRFRAERSAGKYGLRAYRCLYGDHWHIGHEARNPERVAEAEAAERTKYREQAQADRERWQQRWADKYAA